MRRLRHLLPIALAVLTVMCGGVLAVRASAARARDAEATIGTALADQGSALLRGDRPGWLRDVDRSLHQEMTRLYENLHGFEISGWIPRTTHVSGDDSRWRAAVQVRVCFAGARCRRDADSYVPLGDVIAASTTWRIDQERAVLTDFTISSSAAAVPWKTAALTFTTGERVIVAASDPAVRATAWAAVADRAAKAADRFALSTPEPGRYLIYLAADQEWDSAIGEDREAAAFVDRTSRETAFTVVDATEPPDERLLRHELGHVATLLGTLGRGADWAVEGMAEYIAWEQTPISAYRLTAGARDHVARTAWNGRLDLEWTDERTHRAGFYAMAYLAFRCLATTYGETRLLRFFSAVVRDGRTATAAAEPALGTPWPQVETTCRPRIKEWLSQ